MPTFHPFSSRRGKNTTTLFDIRLENDFLVFRGNEHESSGQLLKGVVALCVPEPTKVEDISLRLSGTQRFLWTDSKITAAGISTHKTDRTTTILNHQWAPFWGTPGRTAILPKGNYEFPFELLLPGDSAESVEGINEASITYKLKATIARGKFAYDIHAYKHVRVVRTLEPSALEFLHAMSVENIWPNKVEYSINVPQKGIVFGSTVPLETRFTPLLKGLEIGSISIKLIEVHDFIYQGISAHSAKEHKKEREVASWVRPVTREEHWQEMIEDTGQEGWVLNTGLDLPKKLGKCVQDVNTHGIKIRHKLKLIVSLHNPDSHISELRATLPITIFISPNIPLDEAGNLTRPAHVPGTMDQANRIAPPGYGEHVLDQLYDDLDTATLHTPAGPSGANTPLYGHSRAGSHDNLTAAGASSAIPPAALSSRLQDMSLDSPSRNSSYLSVTPGSGGNSPASPYAASADSPDHSPLPSAPLSRQSTGSSHSGHTMPEHIELSELCKVPSYATAMKSTRVAPLNLLQGTRLPDYVTATSTPGTPNVTPVADPFSTIREEPLDPVRTGPVLGGRRQSSMGHLLIPDYMSHVGDVEERQRLHLMQIRERVA